MREVSENGNELNAPAVIVPSPRATLPSQAASALRSTRVIRPSPPPCPRPDRVERSAEDRKSTRLNSSHVSISYAVFCLKKKKRILSLGSPVHITSDPMRSLLAH